jgi:lysophospholipase L1-like esterase
VSAALVWALGSSAGAATARPAPAKILLALGDSLAAGYQPVDGTSVLPPVDPETQFRDQGYPQSYPADLAAIRHLRLIDLGCPGETTRSMRGTPAETACASLYRKEFDAGSQLAAAERFLARNAGKVGMVTLDIGANDLDACVTTHGADLGCLADHDATALNDLTADLRALTAAVHRFDRGTPVEAMNYYDPFLGLAYSPGGGNGSSLAAETLAATDIFNSQITATFHAFGVGVADVATAFRIHARTPTSVFGGKSLPLDVATVCRLTWMCPTGAGSKQDIHPNPSGYRVIAQAFVAELTR